MRGPQVAGMADVAVNAKLQAALRLQQWWHKCACSCCAAEQPAAEQPVP